MRKALCLILLCLLLGGCRARSALDSSAPTVPAVSEESLPVSLYAPGHPLEACAPGALRIYPMGQQVHGLAAMGENLIALCGRESTTLTLLTGEDPAVSKTVELSFLLREDDPSFQVYPDSLSYFDPVRRETVVLNDRLEDVCRIAAPEGLVGSPILSADGSSLYYCTPTAIRAWDLATGIRRCVKELSYDGQTLTGLHQEGTILQCRIQKDGEAKTLFLAEDTGRLLREVPGDVTLVTQGSEYYAALPEGSVRLQLFGQADAAPQLLTPGDIYASCQYLANQRRVITISQGQSLTFDCYDLDSGLRIASLILPEDYEFVSLAAREADSVFLLLRDQASSGILCQWDLYADATCTGDVQRYVGPRYTADSPDITELARCQREAARIGEQYGIQLLVWDEPLDIMPWDYEFVPEYLAPVLSRALSALDRHLSYYPPEILTGIKSHFSELTICLVRSIQGSAESGSLETAAGVQFHQDGCAYIAISVGRFAERTLYHELYHVMETRLLTDSTALDHWDALNPAGFSYDLDYTANRDRSGEEYLQPETRAFIDTYSMSYPKEDRARILEYAMCEGNENLFRSTTMQAKLRCLSRAIREAYGLKESPETFRWEQYLI